MYLLLYPGPVLAASCHIVFVLYFVFVIQFYVAPQARPNHPEVIKDMLFYQSLLGNRAMGNV